MKKYTLLKSGISLLLVLLMLVSAVACKKNKGDENVNSNDQATNEEADGYVKDGVPDDYNLDGREIRILCRAGEMRQYDVDGGGELLGDVVHEAVFNRNEKVAKRLNCTFTITEMEGDWKTFGDTMEVQLTTGDDLWDIVNVQGNASLSRSRDYLFASLEESTWLDFEREWWNYEAMKEISTDGTGIRFLVGDISLSMHQYSGAMFFNKRLLMSNGVNPNELYKTVIDRQWTYEKLGEMAADLCSDENGDGTIADGDIYGLAIFSSEDLKYLEYGMDVRRYTRGEDGVPVMDYDQYRAQTGVEAILKLVNTEGVEYFNTGRDFKLFTSGRSVFLSAYLGAASYGMFRSMQDAYGIVPIPMLDGQQKEYINYIHDSASFFAVPVTCMDTEPIGAVLEVLCAESYRSVVPIYFETAMKAKYSKDSESGQCIDIIRAVSKKDYLTEHNTIYNNRGCAFLISRQVLNGQNSFSSDYEKDVDQVNLTIRETIEKLKDLQK